MLQEGMLILALLATAQIDFCRISAYLPKEQTALGMLA